MSKAKSNLEMTVCYRNPVDLKPHELLKDLPMLADDHPDFTSLCDEVLRGGAMSPIFITADNKIVEGRHRCRAFKFAQRDVPCIVVPDEEIEHVALKANTLRRHLLKFQIAFAYYPVIERAIERAKERKLQNLKGQSTESPAAGLSGTASTAEDLADQLGISRALLFEAKKTRELLEEFDKANGPKTWPDSPKKKLTAMAYYTPKIMADENPIGLGAVRAGLGGKVTTGGKDRPQREVKKILVSAAVTITNQMAELGSLDALSPEERKEVRDHFAAQFLTQRKWTAKECDKAITGLDELKKEFQRLKKLAGETNEEEEQGR